MTQEKKKYLLQLHLGAVEDRERVVDFHVGFIYATNADGSPICPGYARRFEEAQKSIKVQGIRTIFSNVSLDDLFNDIQSRFATPRVGEERNPVVFKYENRHREDICARFLEYSQK